MVSAGTRITFAVSGVTSLYVGTTALAVQGHVVDALNAIFYVDSLTVTPPNVLTDVLNGFFVNTPYTAQVTVETRVDYAAVQDVASIVANAFANEVGAVPVVTAPAYGQPTPAPATTITTLPDFGTALQNAAAGAGTDLSKLFKPVTDLLDQAGLLVVVGIVVIVGLIAFSPTGPVVGARV